MKIWFVRIMADENLAINSAATKTFQSLIKQNLSALLQTWQLIQENMVNGKPL